MVNLYNNKIITTKADIWVSDCDNCDLSAGGHENQSEHNGPRLILNMSIC